MVPKTDRQEIAVSALPAGPLAAGEAGPD